MTDIFLNRDVEGLCAAPYRLARSGDETVTLPDLPPVYIPPLPAPFVGGDISAGLAALLDANIPRPFVLADLGTNGELALVTEAGGLWLTSVPLGPALEGIGPECGQLAGPGVITGFALAPSGVAARFYETSAAKNTSQTPHDRRDGGDRAGKGQRPAYRRDDDTSAGRGPSDRPSRDDRARRDDRPRRDDRQDRRDDRGSQGGRPSRPQGSDRPRRDDRQDKQDKHAGGFSAPHRQCRVKNR